MKKIKLLLLVIGYSFILFACYGTQTEAPTMPQITTDEGKACVRHCQSIYAECNGACSQMIGGARTASQREQCLNNCNTTLKDCYITCE